MIRYIFFILFLGLIQIANSQDSYFQQEVNYKINAKLIDSIHTLEAYIEIEYINNSPDQLNEIYIQLWGNAFKNRSTAFAKQKLRTRNTDFYYADEDELGFYSNLDFKVDNKIARLEFDKEHIDMARIILSKPLNPGERIQISTPYRLRIPNSFSRLGHVETSYQLTQWYPKPAVYDKNGWHPMPYLDLGEFYSEFGNFDVQISVPSNYFVAATGTLQTQEEIENINNRIIYTTEYLKDSTSNHIEFPESSDMYKTIRFKAQNVHDFAWFADKRFLIKREIAELKSGKKVECNAFFTDKEKNLWENGAFYVARAVKFYSERVGEYPYPQATAVQSALSAGAGMEYPMITVIGVSGNAPSLDQVITHEVGHNWFYGILGSNERDFPWMDEGMNSYHDHKYMDVFYDDFDEVGGILPKKIKKEMEYSSLAYVYQIFAGIGKDQSPGTTSNDLTSINYFLCAYEKPAMSFKQLEQYIGEESLLSAMRDYYEKWKFGHPQPEDVKASFESSLDMNLDWLFDGFLNSNMTYDYAIKGFEESQNSLTIINRGSIAAPFPISLMNEGKEADEIWFEGFIGTKTVSLSNIEFDEIQIDKDRITLDINASNNRHRVNKSSKGKPIAIRFLTGIRNSKKNKLFTFPTLSGNTSDGIQLGLALHNYGIPLSTFQYYIHPVLGINSKELLGSFELRKDFPIKKNTLRNISLSMGGKTFHESENIDDGYNIRFTRINPKVEFEWQKKLVSPAKHFLSYRPIIIIKDNARYGRETGFEGLDQQLSVIHELGYELEKSSPINPMTLKINSEFWQYENFGNGTNFLKLFGQLDSKYAYKKGKFFEMRFFAGFFPLHGEKESSTRSAEGNFSLFHRGFNDYKYDHHFIDRTGQDGFWSRQVNWNDGAFKNGISSAYPIGLSNNYMASVNLSIDLPFSWSNLVPIKPYFDAGIYSFKPTSNSEFQQEILYSGGIMLDFRKTVGIYLPLINSEKISNIYSESTDNIFQRISFTIDINKLNPHTLKRWFTY